MSQYYLPDPRDRNGSLDRIIDVNGRNLRRPENVPDQDSSLILDYWRLLLRRKKVVSLVALGGLLLGVLYGLTQPFNYSARTTVEVQGLNENFMNMRDFDPTSRGTNMSQEAYIQTQTKLLQSDSVLKRALKRLRSEGKPVPVANRSPFTEVKEKLWGGEPKKVSAEELSMELLKNLKVRSLGYTRILEISTMSQDPQLAAEFTNAMAEEFGQQDLEVRWETAQKMTDWFGKQLDTLRLKLKTGEEQLRAYAQRANLLVSSDKDRESVAQEKLRMLQQELSKAQAERVVKQSMYETGKSSAPDSIPLVLDSGPLREYQIRLTDLRRQKAELDTTLTPDHYKVQRVAAQIAEIEESMKRERSNVIRRINNEYDTSKRREALLQEAYNKQLSTVSNLSSSEIQYEMLKREVESTRSIYDTMLTRLKEAGMASALKASTVRMVDKAEASAMPDSPDLTMLGVMGLLVGLIGGVAVAFIQDRTDRSIRVPGDAAQHLRVRELGVIPTSIPNGFKAKSMLFNLNGNGDSSAPESKMDPLALATFKQDPSLMTESFRATMYSILFAGPHSVLVFTSPNESEGKTTVVSNLGIALAEINRRVLIIDGDLRRPRLHKVMGHDNEWGLSDLLTETRPIADYRPGELALETAVPGLSIVPSGIPKLSMAKVLSTPRLKELLARLRDEYDIVLIDSPPVLQVPDARLLGKLADGVLLVIRAGKTTRDMALVARQCLTDDGTEVVGTILNQWDPKNAARPGYYSYYYGQHA